MQTKGHSDCCLSSAMLYCDHCCQAFEGMPYRVKSEESGVVLLDMIVCYNCYAEARELGHHGGHLSASIALTEGSFFGKESQLR